MTEPALRTENLTKSFGGLTAVDKLNLSIPSGRLHAIIGPNGAGKTTFFNLVSGLLTADSGRVYFKGRDITGLKPHDVSRLGIKRTMQIKSVFPQLSVTDNLWVTRHATTRNSAPLSRSLARHRDAPACRAHSRADRSDGTCQSPAGTLSYGDVALLEIGMALISDPQLLLLDEPTCGMSPAETERAVAKIKQLARTIDIVIIEHDMSVVFEIADDITVMAQGGILASGSPDEISGDERVREAYLGRPEDEDYVEEAIHA